MKCFFALIMLAVALALTGCGEVADLLDGTVEKSVTLNRVFHDGISERNVQHALIVEAVRVSGGQAIPTGLVSLETLADRIDIDQSGEADVQFFVEGHLRNKSALAAQLTIFAISESDPALAPREVGSITLAAGETRELTGADELDQTPEEIDARLRELFATLGANFQLTPIIQVTGGDQEGVAVDWIFFSSMPAYRHTEEMFDPAEVGQYRKNIKSIDKVRLTGTIANDGANLAEVRLYLSSQAVPNPETDLVAQATIMPNEQIYGEDLLLADGAKIITERLKNVLDGGDAFYTLVIVSRDPLKVQSDRLQLAIQVTAEREIF